MTQEEKDELYELLLAETSDIHAGIIVVFLRQNVGDVPQAQAARAIELIKKMGNFNAALSEYVSAGKSTDYNRLARAKEILKELEGGEQNA